MSLCKHTKAETSSIASAETEPAIDISKEVVLKAYLLPDQPTGAAAVYEELNKKLKADINCTVDLKFTGWTDWQNKYAMMLASGEPLDFIYSSNWANYAENASKSAFREIDMETVQKYMPKSYAAINKETWDDAKLNGKIYLIPSAHNFFSAWGMLYREDLRKKYGVPEIKTIVDIPVLLEAVKKNDPGMIPFNMSKFEIVTAFDTFNFQWNGYGVNFKIISGDLDILYYNLDDTTYSLKGIFDPEYIDGFKKTAQLMKQMQDKGLIPKNPYANQTRSKDVILENKTAVAWGNTEEFIDYYAQAKAKGMELKSVYGSSANGKIQRNPGISDGIAIPNSAANPERAMMALDLIMEDESYNYLMSFGIPGKNYVVTSDDKIGLPEGVTAANNEYPLYGAGWWFCNRDLWKPFATWDPFYLEQKNELAPMAINHPLAAFNPIYDSVKTELANSQNVQAKYANTILIGLSKDIDADIANLQDQYKIAGLDKVQAEVKKQADAFLNSRK